MNEFIQGEMRVFVVPVDILKRADLSTHEKMIYIALSSFLNAHSATAWPSYSTLAQLGSMTRRAAIKCVQGLFEKGLLSKQTQYTVTADKNFRATSNLYTVKAPGVVNTVHHGSEPRSPGVVNTVHQGSEPSSPNQNHLTDQDIKDDDGSAIELEIFEKVKGELTEEQYKKIVQRVKAKKPRHYAEYLYKAVQTEIADMQTAATAAPAQQRGSKKNGGSKRPTLQVAKTSSATMTPEELEEVRKLARRLQEQK